MRKSTIISLLAIFIFSSCLMTSTPNIHAQQSTGLSAMTLVSFGDNNSSTGTNIPSIENKTVSYFGNSSGYLVYPSLNQSGTTEKKLPAVVMIHENKGLNDYIKESANILAKNGYVVLAVDLFNGEVTTDQNRSRELTSVIRENPDVALENLKGAVTYLGSLDNVNASKIASLGWCFGGTAVPRIISK